ncbi:MAG: hypothetical protein PHQ41_01450 [Candidatus Cloacimonetes bacterium]|nr:hypothetical protein [Candidatus Cloacimonadota bacterium]
MRTLFTLVIAILMICPSCILFARDRNCDILHTDPLLFKDYNVLVINDHSCKMKVCLVKVDFSYTSKSELDKVIDLFGHSDSSSTCDRSDRTKAYISAQNILLQLIELPDTLKIVIPAEERGRFSWDTYFQYHYQGRAYQYVDMRKKKFLLPVYFSPDLIWNEDGLVYIRNHPK